MIIAKKPLLLAALPAGVLIAAAVAMATARKSPRDTGANEDISTRAARAPNSSSEMERELEQMRRELQATKAIALAARDAPAPAAVAPPKPDESSEGATDGRHEEETIEQWRDDLSSQFYAEAHDRNWSVPSEELLTNNLEDALSGPSTLVSLECRETVCRAQIKHPDLESHTEFVRAYTQSVKWPGPGMVTLDESAAPGDVVSLAFFSRQEDESATEPEAAF